MPRFYYLSVRLKLALLQRNRNGGFTLPVVIGMGLIMTLAGMTMVVRSQSDQISAVSEKGSAQSTAVAEAGVSEILSFINYVRVVAEKDSDKWSNAYSAS